MPVSKTQIDKAGKVLLDKEAASPSNFHEANLVIDEWRQAHLQPLTDVTLKLQEWLQNDISSLYIAQRLKRKPQILRKLHRAYPMRLSQMQDIAGCRAIFENDIQLVEALSLIRDRARHRYLEIRREDDYRTLGRPESGYRALHLVVGRNGYQVEVQLRTMIQHAWAEEIERTSVICRCQLKEGEGPQELLEYFKDVSHLFHDFDCGLPTKKELLKRAMAGHDNLKKIVGPAREHLISGFNINRQFVLSMEGKEKSTRSRKMSNWLVIFNWNQGTFEHWIQAENNAEKAADQYSSMEESWSVENGYEVVLIGARRVGIIQKTHSHYFGENIFDQYLQGIGIVKLPNTNSNLSSAARIVLGKLYQKDYWGAKKASMDTLKNHYCHGLPNIDEAVDELLRVGYLTSSSKRGPFSLEVDKKREIEETLSPSNKSLTP